MWNWFKCIFIGKECCQHKWVTEKEIRIVERYNENSTLGFQYICKCEKCGTFKKFKFV